MVREIITIDEELCNGCGECVPGCPEGALRIIDGKARLVGDLLCDGLGACLGNCPTGALSVEKREAEAYDEARVMENMIPQGVNTVVAHLQHLHEHGEEENIKVALSVLEGRNFDGKQEVLRRWGKIKIDENTRRATPAFQPVKSAHQGFSGCPGSAARSFGGAERENAAARAVEATPVATELTHWPVQMHLINPGSPHFTGSDFVLAADCTAFSFGAFHPTFLKSKTLGIACPKLDSGVDSYVEKVRLLIDEARINTLTVVIMQVPCCGGLLQVARAAAAQAERNVPIKRIVVGVQGEILEEGWV